MLLLTVFHEILFGETTDCLAANFPSEAVVITTERLIFRREPEARHQALRATTLDHGQIARHAVDGSRFHIHRESFHAEIGGHDHASKMAGGWNAGDRD